MNRILEATAGARLLHPFPIRSQIPDTGAMRPQALSDDVVLATARELATGGVWPSGRRLRDELARRFGHRGRTDRIYRLLAAATHEAGPPRTTVGAAHGERVADLERELAAARAEATAALARAELAEERERRHQDRWMREIYELRQKLAAASPTRVLIDNRDPQDLVRDLKAQLAAAQRDLASLKRP